jgi:hypothetical protein
MPSATEDMNRCCLIWSIRSREMLLGRAPEHRATGRAGRQTGLDERQGRAPVGEISISALDPILRRGGAVKARRRAGAGGATGSSMRRIYLAIIVLLAAATIVFAF